MQKLSSTKISKVGENTIYQLLNNQGSGDVKFANGDFHEGKGYDLDWNGVRINVKTATESKKTRTAYVFTSAGFSEKIVFVFVGLVDGGTWNDHYYWVSAQPKGKVSVYLKIADAVKADQLGEKIMEVHKSMQS